VHARSALFDLYGDHLRSRGGQAPIAALVKLLAPLGIAPPAVRTAVSRMVRQGWLEPVRLPGGPGYGLTPRAVRRLDDAAARIYRTGDTTWRGRFDLLVFTSPVDRTVRPRLEATLTYLGYAALERGTWLSPRPAGELDAVLAEFGVTAQRFSAEPVGGIAEAMAVVRRAWDLDRLAEAYRRFIAEAEPMLAAVGTHPSDEAAYAARFRLVHAWRNFLFQDPCLPAELLPHPWPGTIAAQFFNRYALQLRPAADRYVDSCLADHSGR